MQFLQINQKTTFRDLSDQVGASNVEKMLSLNNLTRSANIGEQMYSRNAQIVASQPDVTWQRKSSLLNTFVDDSDIFEKAATLDDNEWKVLSATNAFYDYMKVPETINLPYSANILGDNTHISDLVYRQAMNQLECNPHIIDPSVFSQYGSTGSSGIIETTSSEVTSLFSWAHIPWGEVTLYSSIDGSSIDFPVYPEAISDSRKANYATMPDLLYQYEPWYLFQGSGPRACTYKFDFHRDMWTGDHRDGKANELVRFCEAHTFANYKGAAIEVPLVTLYVHGDPLIHGIVTDVSTDKDGPIGLDGFYLHYVLSLSITEISEEALNFNTVKNKPLIG